MANNAYTITGNTVIDDTKTLWGNIVKYNTLLFDGYQGLNYGYSIGGFIGPATYDSTIDRWNLSGSDSYGNFVGDLPYNGDIGGGCGSSEYGYYFGGYNNNTGFIIDTIYRFPFAAATTGVTDTTANLTRVKGYLVGVNNSTYGYSLGGWIPNAPSPGSTYYTDIDRWPFASSTTNASDIGDLIVGKNAGSQQVSDEYAYYTGGTGIGPGAYADVERFPFASDTPTSVDVGNIFGTARYSEKGASSKENGYGIGGQSSPSVFYSTIQTFPFASTGFTCTNPGTLTAARSTGAHASSPDYGHYAGGYTTSSVYHDNIDVFPFASTTVSCVTVGNLTQNRGFLTSNHF